MFYRHTMRKSDEAHAKLDKCQQQNIEYVQIIHNERAGGKMLRKTIIEHKRKISDLNATIFGLKMKYTDLSSAHENLKRQHQQLQTKVSTLLAASLETTTNNNGDVQSSLSSEDNPAPSSPRTPPRSNAQKASGLQREKTPKRKVRKKTIKKTHQNSTDTGYKTRSRKKRPRS